MVSKFKQFFDFKNNFKQPKSTFTADWELTQNDLEAKNKKRLSFNGGYFNTAAGIGGSSDVLQYGYNNVGNFQTFKHYDDLYRTNFFAQKIIDCPAEDMTRKWREFVYDNVKVVEQRTQCEIDLGISAQVQDAIRWANLYGGSALLIVLQDKTIEDYGKPLDITKIKKGSVEKLQPIFMGELTTTSMINYNPTYSNFAESDYYMINNFGKVHSSWLIRFVGVPLSLYASLTQQTFGDSRLRACEDILQGISLMVTNIPNLVARANIDVIGLPNFDLFAGRSSSNVFDSLGLMNQIRNNLGVLVTDSESTFERHPLTGLDGINALLLQYIQMAASVTGTPLTKFLGTSIAGFGSGDNELTQYYDAIHAKQTALREQIKKIDQVIECHLYGKVLDIKYEWIPLNEPTAAESADINLKNAQAMQMHLDMGTVTPQILANEMKKQGLYDGLTDEFIATLSDEVVEDASDEDLKSLLGGASVKTA
jgi:hypothetical protein